jgi:cell wall-associated NlpC family hydrolase
MDLKVKTDYLQGTARRRYLADFKRPPKAFDRARHLPTGFYVYEYMRYIWLIFLGLAVVIAAVSWSKRAAAPRTASLAPTGTTPAALVAATAPSASPDARRRLTLRQALLPAAGSQATAESLGPVADSLVLFALRQVGVPYRWAGTTPEGGFDCSGFLMYAYAHVGVPVPHSTALLISTGQPVPRTEARPGDLVVFTGTATTSTTPGHAGIVVSRLGEVPLRFVHSSSARRESGVKISQVEGTDYERRFMQVRRVLSGNVLVAGAQPTRAGTGAATARPRIGAIVAPLESRSAAIQVADDAEPAPPAHLAPLVRKPAVKRSHAVRAVKVAATKKKSVRTAPKATATRTKANAAGKGQPKSPVKKPVKKTPSTKSKPKARTTSATPNRR